jgi:hypothetical protein
MSLHFYRIGEPFDGNSTNEGHLFLVSIFREIDKGDSISLVEALPRSDHAAAVLEAQALVQKHDALDVVRAKNLILWARRKKQEHIDKALERKSTTPTPTTKESSQIRFTL